MLIERRFFAKYSTFFFELFKTPNRKLSRLLLIQCSNLVQEKCINIANPNITCNDLQITIQYTIHRSLKDLT